MSPLAKRRRYVRHRIKKARRMSVYAMDQYQCVYCGVTPSEEKRTLDHVMSVSAMLEFPNSIINSISNLVTACFKCNRRLANASFEKKVFRFGRFQHKEMVNV